MPNLTTCGTWRRENNKNRHGFNSQFVHHFSMASGESSSHLQLGVRMPFMPFANPTWLVMEKSPLFSTKKGTTSTNWSNRPCSSNFHGYVSLPEGMINLCITLLGVLWFKHGAGRQWEENTSHHFGDFFKWILWECMGLLWHLKNKHCIL